MLSLPELETKATKSPALSMLKAEGGLHALCARTLPLSPPAPWMRVPCATLCPKAWHPLWHSCLAAAWHQQLYHDTKSTCRGDSGVRCARQLSLHCRWDWWDRQCDLPGGRGSLGAGLGYMTLPFLPWRNRCPLTQVRNRF